MVKFKKSGIYPIVAYQCWFSSFDKCTMVMQDVSTGGNGWGITKAPDCPGRCGSTGREYRPVNRRVAGAQGRAQGRGGLSPPPPSLKAMKRKKCAQVRIKKEKPTLCIIIITVNLNYSKIKSFFLNYQRMWYIYYIMKQRAVFKSCARFFLKVVRPIYGYIPAF